MGLFSSKPKPKLILNSQGEALSSYAWGNATVIEGAELSKLSLWQNARNVLLDSTEQLEKAEYVYHKAVDVEEKAHKAVQKITK
jgi:hypothetical protein